MVVVAKLELKLSYEGYRGIITGTELFGLLFTHPSKLTMNFNGVMH